MLYTVLCAYDIFVLNTQVYKDQSFFHSEQFNARFLLITVLCHNLVSPFSSLDRDPRRPVTFGQPIFSPISLVEQ